jgi:hypothetical protein
MTASCDRTARLVVAESPAMRTLPYDERSGHGASANPGWKLLSGVCFECPSNSFHEAVGSTTTWFVASIRIWSFTAALDVSPRTGRCATLFTPESTIDASVIARGTCPVTVIPSSCARWMIAPATSGLMSVYNFIC